MMNIVEPQFAAEAVSSKGKIFKFDAIECLINYTLEKEETEFALKLVVDYNEGNNWIEAQTSHYLVSENLPSPMGGNLSAYKDKGSAEAMRSAKEGTVYDWESILKQYSK
jgi:copper chaperone NosL